MIAQQSDQLTVRDQTVALPPTCQSIEWYSEGEERVVDVGGVRIAVRFVGRKGRRARIAITAPPGTVFRARG
jgi:hypothetical protein